MKDKTKLKKFIVKVTETFVKEIEVYSKDEKEVLDKIEQIELSYLEGDIILSAENFTNYKIELKEIENSE